MTDRNDKATQRDFSHYKDNYREQVQGSIAFSGQDVEFFTEVKARHLIDLAKKYLGDPGELSTLDVGCGVGLTDRFLAPHLGALYGVDLSEGVIEKAAQTNPSAQYQVYDGRTLPFPDNVMDLVFAICVLHHVPPPSWENFVREMKRVTTNRGLVVVFEHNPLNPATRRAVGSCAFDINAVLLRRRSTRELFLRSRLYLLEQRYIVFFPFRSAIFSRLERRLGWLPIGAQYFVVGKKLDG